MPGFGNAQCSMVVHLVIVGWHRVEVSRTMSAIVARPASACPHHCPPHTCAKRHQCALSLGASTSNHPLACYFVCLRLRARDLFYWSGAPCVALQNARTST
eukprot:scaffold289961_cov37-Tisochrysis_lutea.AAC.1